MFGQRLVEFAKVVSATIFVVHVAIKNFSMYGLNGKQIARTTSASLDLSGLQAVCQANITMRVSVLASPSHVLFCTYPGSRLLRDTAQ